MRVLQSLLFYPRGGSAHVARSLSRELRRRGHEPHVVAGSLGDAGEPSNAHTFYAGLPVEAMNYDSARTAFAAGADPMSSDEPFHPSYEDRGHVPDRLFTLVSPDLAGWAEERWRQFFESRREQLSPDVLHVHHLTSQGHAAKRVFSSAPMIVHLHGTELKMLTSMPDDSVAASVGDRPYRAFWLDYARRLVTQADAVVVVSPTDARLAVEHLGVPRANVHHIPNGVDEHLFRPPDRTAAELDRARVLAKYLVDDPKGWKPGEDVGSLRYDIETLPALTGGTKERLVTYVGRFTAVKRVNLLIETFSKLRVEGEKVTLIIWGGFPEEWEGEHPYAFAERNGVPSIFFTGWRTHDELAEFLPMVDLLVLPSVDESFGQVLLEAMACGTAVIAVDRNGPPTFIRTDSADANGWLVPPDDSATLLRTIRDALHDDDERRKRVAAARALVLEQYTWSAATERFITLYRQGLA